MTAIFGVDSKIPSNTRLDNGFRLYDWVMRKNSFPVFWGRNISGENCLCEEEIEFLHKKGCLIYLIFDDLTEAGVSKVNGTEDAYRALDAVRKLNVLQEKGTAIFAHIRSDWTVSHNWMISFAATVKNEGYIPGFIGNTDSSMNFNFDRQYGHFLNATVKSEYFGSIVCATEPKTNEEPNAWLPFTPSDIPREDIALWQNGSIMYKDFEVNTTYARDKSILEYMWK